MSNPERLGDILKRTLAEMEPRVEPAPGGPRATMLAFFRGESPPAPSKEQPSQPAPTHPLDEEPF